jgi:hypothetical protein
MAAAAWPKALLWGSLPWLLLLAPHASSGLRLEHRRAEEKEEEEEDGTRCLKTSYGTVSGGSRSHH